VSAKTIDWRDLASDRPHFTVLGGGLRHVEGETLEELNARDEWELREDIVCFQLGDVFVDVGWYGPFETKPAEGRFRLYMGFSDEDHGWTPVEEIATRDPGEVPGAVRTLLDRAEALHAQRSVATP